MAQRHRRMDGVRVHSAKGDVSGQRTMEEKDTGMVSCCRQPSEEEGRLQRAIENNNSCTTQHYTSSFKIPNLHIPLTATDFPSQSQELVTNWK